METELTVKVKFQIGDKVKVASGDLTGIVKMIGLEANDKIEYLVEYVSKEGLPDSRWYDPPFLDKIA